jgi:hypothetical protein
LWKSSYFLEQEKNKVRRTVVPKADREKAFFFIQKVLKGEEWVVVEVEWQIVEISHKPIRIQP